MSPSFAQVVNAVATCPPGSTRTSRIEIFVFGFGKAGTTQIGRRPTTTYEGGAPRVDVKPEDGRIELAADTIATLLPGATVDGLEAVDVEHTLEEGKLRTTIWGRRAQRTGSRPQ